GAAVWLAVKFHRRPGGDDELPDPVQIHGHNKLEITWTVIPFLILLPISVFTVASVIDLAREPKNALEVDVYGQQWWWSFEYDLNHDGKPEIITANDLVLPAGQTIVLHVQSRDVIHSFWIPALNGTADAVPGRDHRLLVQAHQPGIFLGQCKEFCGLSHARMAARAVILSKSDFQTWLDQQQEDAQAPTTDSAKAGLEIWKTKCASCHQINGVNDGREGNAAQVSGTAPNLTHLMSRGVFASGQFELYNADGSVNRPALEAWLRNPPGLLPMAPPDRGMPNLNLSDQEIDQLVDFLVTLGPPPPGK
ncbi:MAG TPA: cytochrome c oxidase subunit II, partial [Acidimicrobiales bacterium]